MCVCSIQINQIAFTASFLSKGKQLVESQFEKYVPVTRLKYYFAVDNNYVVRKLILLLFPFTHRVRRGINIGFDQKIQQYFTYFFSAQRRIGP